MMRLLLLVLMIVSFQPSISFASIQPQPVKRTHSSQKAVAAKKVTHKQLAHHTTSKHRKRSVVAARHLEPRSPYIALNKLPQPELPLNNTMTAKRRGFASSVSSVKDTLVSFVHKTVDSLNYSSYKLGGKRFDVSRGIYVLDCSDYVDNILQSTTPNAYMNLVNTTGAEKPTSQHYYNFFSGLSKKNYYWNRIDEVEKLLPGDILVFRGKSRRRSGASGHVMIVMNKPSPIEDAYLVRVADSAPVAHSQDTRAGRSGIGIGTLLLKADPDTGQPAAYAWKVGSRWKSNVSFAMARPAGVY